MATGGVTRLWNEATNRMMPKIDMTPNRLRASLAKTRSTSRNAVRSPSGFNTQTPQKIGVIAEFMYRIGSIKAKPASWKDMFFPEVQRMPGD